MAGYVKRKAIRDELSNTDWYSINNDGKLILGASDGDTALFKARDAFEAIDRPPTADVVEIKRGEWLLLDECANRGVYCSVCHKKVYKTDYANQKIKSNYCPNCGADMRGVSR